MTLTKYHPSRDLSVAKVQLFFRRYFTMEKTQQTNGKKSEGSTSSLHYMSYLENTVWLGL